MKRSLRIADAPPPAAWSPRRNQYIAPEGYQGPPFPARNGFDAYPLDLDAGLRFTREGQKRWPEWDAALSNGGGSMFRAMVSGLCPLFDAAVQAARIARPAFGPWAGAPQGNPLDFDKITFPELPKVGG